MRCFVAILLGFLVISPICAQSTPSTQSKIDGPEGKPGILESSIKMVANGQGDKVEAEVGTFLVPENRQNPTDKVIEIPFYRLKCTADESTAAPIFLLAGGPGASWIDRFRNEENFREVQFYRTMADVVLFDQRGCGHSRPKLEYSEQRQFPLLDPLDPEVVAKELREMSAACRTKLVDEGIDLSAYNTVENAADVDELRRALGYEKVTLIGGSYGSHLALAIMKQFPSSVERAVLYGIEGLDHTWDDPAGYLATLQRIAAAAEASPELAPHIPEGGLLAALQTVIDRLEDHPQQVTFRRRGKELTVVVDAHLVRRLVGFQAGRKSRINLWPELILDLYEEDYSNVVQGAYALRSLRLHRPVHYLMDCSSGISTARQSRYESDADTELLGDINLEYASLTDVWQVPDLGDEFRADFECAVPTLIVHGTWDTSTPIENAREVAAMLTNSRLVEVVTGSHGALYNLYEHWPPAHEKIGAFLCGQRVTFPSQVDLSGVKFQPRGARGANGR